MASTKDKLIWAARKITSQGPGYLPLRLWSPVKRSWVDLLYSAGWMTERAESLVSEVVGMPSVHGRVRSPRALRWHWDEADIPAIVRSVPEDRRAIAISQAEEFADRRFTFRGRRPKTLGMGEWSPEAVSRGWIWDLNRHHWFATLGFAYRYNGDTRFLQSFIEQSSDWMDHHLVRLGRIAWDNPFEVASRINAWLWAHFLFLSSPEWPIAHYKRFVRGLGLLAEYLNQTIEHHAPGNHIFLEAKTLALVGEVFPRAKGAAGWRRNGWQILNRELRKQICDDGVHVERSTMYHRIVAGELAELWFLCRRHNPPPATSLEGFVERMAEFQKWIDHGDGSLPLFGDAQIEDTYYRFSAPAAVSAARGFLARDVTTESTDHSIWLLGAGWSQGGPTQPAEEAAAGKAFQQGGYYVARSGWTKDSDVLVWDCGPAGFDKNRKHAHLDALSFTLSVNGQPLLIDPGVHEATCHAVSLRSTRAHNTVCIDGEDAGILAERNEIWSPPRAELLLWANSSDCTVMSGRHDGYRRLREPVDVVRTIVAMHGLYWLFVDQIEGSGRHLMEQRFHVVPGAEVAIRQDGDGIDISKESASLSLTWAVEPPYGQSRSETEPRELRIESSMAELYCGRPEPSCTITAKRFGRVPLSLAVIATSAGSDVRVHWIGTAERSTSLLISGRDFQHQVHIGRGTDCTSPLPKGWKTDAQFSISRQVAGVESHDVLLPRCSRVWRGECEFLADTGEHDAIEGFRRILLD